ncbi:MAG: CBS domain-containing protein [Vicinamibacterales bacterium]
MTHIPAVATVMTPFPYSVGVDASLRQAHEMMVAHQVRHLPVLRGHALVGVVSDRDIKRALDPDLGLPPMDELFVRDVYVPEPISVDDAAPLDEVLEQMASEHIGSVLVTKHGRLVGIFTSTDACRVYCAHLRTLFPQGSGEEVA